MQYQFNLKRLLKVIKTKVLVTLFELYNVNIIGTTSEWVYVWLSPAETGWQKADTLGFIIISSPAPHWTPAETGQWVAINGDLISIRRVADKRCRFRSVWLNRSATFWSRVGRFELEDRESRADGDGTRISWVWALNANWWTFWPFDVVFACD